MKIFIDAANLNEIRRGADLGVLDGIPTNPAPAGREKARELLGEMIEPAESKVGR